MVLVLPEAEVWKVVVNGTTTTATTTSEHTSEGSALSAAESTKKYIEARWTLTTGLTNEHVSLTMSCRTAKEIWATLDTINENPGISNELFQRQKCFRVRMEETTKMLDHITKVENLARQLEASESHVEDDDTLLTLHISLLNSYNNLVTALETREAGLQLTDAKAKLLHEEAKREASVEGTLIPSTNEKIKAFIGQGEKCFSGKRYSRQGHFRSKKN